MLNSWLQPGHLADQHLHCAAQANLEGVTAAALDGYGAQLWMLAPPCQPFTRRGLQRDTADGRAASFLKLLALLPGLKVALEIPLLVDKQLLNQ